MAIFPKGVQVDGAVLNFDGLSVHRTDPLLHFISILT